MNEPDQEGGPLDDTRSRLLEAAGPIFADKGYEHATVREICQAAGVNVASVNYYFRDKQRLYIEAVKEASRQRMERFPIPQDDQDAAPEEQLRSFIIALVERMLIEDESSWQTRLMRREMIEPSDACRELIEERLRPDFEHLLAIIERLVPSDTPKYVMRQVAFSVVGQCLYYRIGHDVVRMLTPRREWQQHFSRVQLADHIWRFTLAALGKHPFHEIDHAPSSSRATRRPKRRLPSP